MKYYLHDSNSFNDEKISELFLNFGYEGLGLFYTLLEKMAAQEKPIKSNVLKSQLNVGKRLDKCWNFMEHIGLIQSNNGDTFNEQLLNFSEKYQIKNQKTKERVKQWRENQKIKESVTHNVHDCNTPKDNISKVKLSKVKESKIEQRKENFALTLQTFLTIYSKDLLNDFYLYWTEPNQSNTKLRFEQQKTWSVELRLKRWAKNDKNFNKNTGESKQAEQIRKTLENNEILNNLYADTNDK